MGVCPAGPTRGCRGCTREQPRSRTHQFQQVGLCREHLSAARANCLQPLPAARSRPRGRREQRADRGLGMETLPHTPRLPGSVLELPGLTVQAGQQQPRRLPDVAAVHGEAAAVLRVGDGHAHPLHQRRQQHEGPGRQQREGSGLGGLLPEAQKGTPFGTHSQDSRGAWVPCSLPAVGGGGGLTLLTESAICPILQELSQDSEGTPVVGHEQSLRALGGPSRKGLASIWNWGLLSPPQTGSPSLQRGEDACLLGAGVQRKESNRPRLQTQLCPSSPQTTPRGCFLLHL